MKEKKFYKVTPFIPVKLTQNTRFSILTNLDLVKNGTWGDKDGGIQRDEMRLLFVQTPNILV